MTTRASHGFTIIESVLFLSVTGLMVVGMFAGISASIGTQRYKDAVETFKSSLQQQYADLSSVYNSREGTWVCQVNGGNLTVQADTSGSGSAAQRGQSGCDILGKYMTIKGSTVESRTVLSVKSGTPGSGTSVEKLASSVYTLGTSPDGVKKSEMEWGTRIAWPKGTNPSDRPTSGATGDRQLAILFVRSPDDGLIYTFTSNTVPENAPNNSDLKGLLVSGLTVPGRAQRLVCIDSDGLVFTQGRGIFIDQRASDSSAIRASVESDFNEGQSC